MQQQNIKIIKIKLCDETTCEVSKKQHYHLDGKLFELVDYPKELIVDGWIEIPVREEVKKPE
jgi:hypothetical protein